MLDIWARFSDFSMYENSTTRMYRNDLPTRYIVPVNHALVLIPRSASLDVLNGPTRLTLPPVAGCKSSCRLVDQSLVHLQSTYAETTPTMISGDCWADAVQLWFHHCAWFWIHHLPRNSSLLCLDLVERCYGDLIRLFTMTAVSMVRATG